MCCCLRGFSLILNLIFFFVFSLTQFSEEISQYWNRDDIWGRLCRQILCPPMIVHSFDKSQGVSMLQEEHMGPRINLRFLGSYQTFCMIVASFVCGQFCFGIPSFGFILLLLASFSYIFLSSFFSDPK